MHLKVFSGACITNAPGCKASFETHVSQEKHDPSRRRRAELAHLRITNYELRITILAPLKTRFLDSGQSIVCILSGIFPTFPPQNLPIFPYFFLFLTPFSSTFFLSFFTLVVFRGGRFTIYDLRFCRAGNTAWHNSSCFLANNSPCFKNSAALPLRISARSALIFNIVQNCRRL